MIYHFVWQQFEFGRNIKAQFSEEARGTNRSQHHAMKLLTCFSQ